MENHGWKYYNHALVSALPPHMTPDLDVLNDKSFWKSFDNKPFFAQWTTDFDCKEQTGWWYCICDRPFDLMSLKSKKRNVIRNAIKYCYVEIADPMLYEEELFLLHNEAQNSYSSVNRQVSQRQAFHNSMERLNKDPDIDFYICFLRENNAPVGYAIVKNYDDYCAFQSQKANPQFEKYQVNAALVNAILEHYSDALGKGYYICDGARNINHITHFQDYLEKYFGFRKAYCRLNMRYNGAARVCVFLMYPFRKMLKKLDGIRPVHNLNGVLKMEEIRRQQNG